jgi:uncharacterized protein YbaP (TraB family)
MAGPALWVVTRDSSSVFLFGHAPWGTSTDAEWFVDPQRKAFEGSTSFWCEVPDPGSADGSLITSYGLAQTSLSEVLDDAAKARLGEAAALVTVDPESLEGLRPWLAAQALDHALRAQIPGDELLDVESVLTTAARDAGKSVHGEFPSAEAAILAFASYGLAEMDYLAWTVDRVIGGVAEMERLADAWTAGDLTEFTKDVTHLERRWPRLFDVLLRQRNRDWLPRIDQMLDDSGDTFVLMGMSHLAGTDNVLQLLTDTELEPRRLS